MRLPVSLALILVTATAAAAQPAGGPQRMHGLWQINVLEAGGERSFHLCAGAGDDVLAHLDAAATQCEPAQWRRDGAYVHMADRCSGAQGGYERSGRFSGDFQYNFQGELQVAGTAPRTLVVDGRRLAPCKALKAGEMRPQGSPGGNLNLGQ